MPIPPSAKRVFKGIIFDVYHWEQTMFDGSTETFEMLKRPNTVQVISTRGDKILLALEEQPTKGPSYTLFGGRVDEGEDEITAAKRELKEEAGLASEDWELLNSWRPHHKIDWQVFLYVARECEKVSEPALDPGEKITTLEVSFDEFVEIVTTNNFWGRELTLDLWRGKVENTTAEFKKKIFK